MKKIYVLYFDLDQWPDGHWIKVVSAYNLDEALELVTEFEDAKEMDPLREQLSHWIEIPVQISKQGTYFPKSVTHVIGGGEYTLTRAIKILYKIL